MIRFPRSIRPPCAAGSGQEPRHGRNGCDRRAGWHQLGWPIGVLALAWVVRWLVMLTCYRLPNSDEVMVGLMARHILAGEHPVFYWAQSYNGTLEAYGTALIFRLFGVSYEALHVAPIACSVLFVGAVMHLAHLLYGRTVALLSGVALAAGPALLLVYSIQPGYNYLQAMAFATLSLSLFLSFRRHGDWWRLPLGTYLFGLALWAQPLAAVYLPSLLVVLFGPLAAAARAAETRWRLLGATLLSLAAIGLALEPAIVFNAHADGASLHFLFSRPSKLHIGLLEKGRRLLLWGTPVLLGFSRPNSQASSFVLWLRRDPLIDTLAVALCSLYLLKVLGSGKALCRRFGAMDQVSRAGTVSLLTLALTVFTAYLCSSWSSSSWSATDPRYLLPLYTLAPLVLQGLGPVPTSRLVCRLGGCVVVLALAGGLVVNLSAPPVASLGGLANRLDALGTQVVYGNYWDVYRLAFVSRTSSWRPSPLVQAWGSALIATHHTWCVPLGRPVAPGLSCPAPGPSGLCAPACGIGTWPISVSSTGLATTWRIIKTMSFVLISVRFEKMIALP